MDATAAATDAAPAPQLPRGVNRVTGGVYVGPQDALDRMVREFGVERVVACVEDLTPAHQQLPQRVRVLHIPVEDTLESNVTQYAGRVVDFIQDYFDEATQRREALARVAEAMKDDAAPAAAEPAAADAEAATPATQEEPPRAEAPPVPAPGAQAAGAAATDAAADESDDDGGAAPSTTPAVYVHCFAGQSRAPAVAAAAMMLVENITLDQALSRFQDTRVRPNPGFITQLVHLDQQLHGESTFDVHGYFIEGLVDMFPHATRAEVDALYKEKGGDIRATRDTLMKRHAAAFFDKDKITVDLLTKAVEVQCVPRAVVQRVYEREGKNRDRALAALMMMQPEELVDMIEAVRDEAEGAGRSSE